MGEEKKEYSRQYKIDVTLKVFLEMAQGKAIKESTAPSEEELELRKLSKWTGIPVEDLKTKTEVELSRIAPFVLEAVATGEPIELGIEGKPVYNGGATINGKPLNVVKLEAGGKLELVIPNGCHSVEGSFKGFKATKLVLMSSSMLEYVNYSYKEDDYERTYLYNSITEVDAGVFRYTSCLRIFDYAFDCCANLTTIPEGLFRFTGQCHYSFYATFADCTGLTSIPSGLFSSAINWKSTDTFYAFGGCTNLTGETPRVGGKKLWELSARFIYGRECFRDCTKLADYNEIPDAWK